MAKIIASLQYQWDIGITSVRDKYPERLKEIAAKTALREARVLHLCNDLQQCQRCPLTDSMCGRARPSRISYVEGQRKDASRLPAR